ncbi:ABC transporter ATP-binding protein [Thermomicrobium sp. 4228-Ro]|uniref:ABC transporter ATP-binding protein n=1 Tax=Thermomicrobium sp. 4228-Ro TaxID=2993937 RepID=UPI0022497A1D|nr:ABC transporter ATP-binding protein [Thermomicrobium sp. 4228-Ro]MCX2728589.1 ABC transporter ATP-binding protein [Thermomicrobium sp. 4228-Ro]
MQPILEVSGVSAAYQLATGQQVHAVDHVSLTVMPGEVLGIVGESGCGKSTLASVLSFTARPPLRVLAGTLSFDAKTVTLASADRIPSDWRGRLIALLPQGAMNALNPTLRVRDFAYDVLRSHDPNVDRQSAIERTRERLEQLSLSARVLDAYPHQLSGGMKQRVVAVISTILNPRILIADEPTSALDVSSQRALVHLLLELLERQIITSILFISHDLPLLSNITDRIAVMYAGEIVELGQTRQIVHSPQHPYTQALIRATLVPGRIKRGQRIEGIPGQPPDLRQPPPGCRFHPRCPYAFERCIKEHPPLQQIDGRLVACWWVFERLQLEPTKRDQ